MKNFKFTGPVAIAFFLILAFTCISLDPERNEGGGFEMFSDNPVPEALCFFFLMCALLSLGRALFAELYDWIERRDNENS